MATLDSSSAESSMDDNSNTDRHLQTLTKPHSFNSTTTANKRSHGGGLRTDVLHDTESAEENCDEGDAEVWGNFTDNFRQVQSVLDRNRVLIQQVNENHQSKIPDNMVKNVALIQEINGNISKIVSLYSDLSTNFSSVFHQRNAAVDAKNDTGDGEGDNMQA